MVTSAEAREPLRALVSFLFTRREVLLNTWRTVCEQDPTLAKVSALSREKFNNLLPLLLDLLEQRLLGQPLKADPVQIATEHGLHRWQKAHSLLETMQELHHLGQPATLRPDQRVSGTVSPNRYGPVAGGPPAGGPADE